MGRMSLTEPEQTELLHIARESIIHGLRYGGAMGINIASFQGILAEPRATFVTLQRHQQLRGCIGMLEAIRPLAVDVSENAFAAAFRDPRFPPVTEQELADLAIHISILSPAEPMSFSSEWDLLIQLRPNVDGLIIEEGNHRATFLPSVWETLPTPLHFLQHLKHKAGLPVDYWSNTLRAYRYTADYIG